jgi:two-component system response regulator MprA
VPRVLYVEDEALLALATADALEASGFDVVLAHDGVDALAKVGDARPDLVVTDYMMPGMDGDEMLRRLRAKGVTAPAILTTALAPRELTEEVLDLFDDYLAKPFGDDDLLRKIGAALDGRNQA